MNRLRELRLEKGLSSRKLAEQVHMSYQNICFLERGMIAFKDEHVKMFCDFYGVSADYLLGYSDERNGVEKRDPFIEDLLNMTDEQLEEIKKFVDYIKHRG